MYCEAYKTSHTYAEPLSPVDAADQKSQKRSPSYSSPQFMRESSKQLTVAESLFAGLDDDTYVRDDDDENKISEI